MGSLKKDTFICLDVEATGLDVREDRILEVAAVRFSEMEVLESFETLIDPERDIPEESFKIHKIDQSMVKGKPKIKEVLPDLFSFIGDDIIIGHGINFDIQIIHYSSLREGMPSDFINHKNIDTLRLARLYGESPSNSLETLRKHFNIAPQGAHRAMNDVIVNLEVFYRLAERFKTTKDILQRLKDPIEFKRWPLGKYKGRTLREMPQNYLEWALHRDFDEDLMFTIQKELKRRKKGTSFLQNTNPFSNL